MGVLEVKLGRLGFFTDPAPHISFVQPFIVGIPVSFPLSANDDRIEPSMVAPRLLSVIVWSLNGTKLNRTKHLLTRSVSTVRIVHSMFYAVAKNL